jgi:hypothetical protein
LPALGTLGLEQHIAQHLILIVNLPKDKKRFEYYSENNKMLI